MNRALLIVDIQNDYFPGRRMELLNPEAAAENAASLANAFRAKGLPVIYMKHISLGEGAEFFLPDTDGIEIHASVTPKESDQVFIKHFPNSFRETGLHAYLDAHQIRHLTICGMMTHICIDTTTRAAVDSRLTVELIGDACATRALTFDGKTTSAEQVHTAYLAAINYAFCPVLSTTSFLEKF